MPHIETLFKTQRIMCMKKYLDSHNSTWKIFLDSYLADFGRSFLIKCNYDARFLSKTLPKFYKQRLSEWENYRKSPVVTLPDVLKEFIWNNKFMCINGKPLFRKRVFKKSIGIRRQNQYCTETPSSNMVLVNRPTRHHLKKVSSLCVTYCLMKVN